MRRRLAILLLPLLVASSAPALAAGSMILSSTSFGAGGDIPKKFTCDDQDVSPELSWNGVPEGTQSFVLLVDDPDAPAGDWTHWVFYDLPASAQSLRENVSKVVEPPGGGRQGYNDFHKIGYGGPCPPAGKPHRYYFRLNALDRTLNLRGGANRKEVEQAMRGHVLAQSELLGKYGRR